MKISTALMTLTLAIAIVFFEGCASFGGSTPSPTIAPTAGAQDAGNQNPSSTPNPTPGTTYVLPVLTDAQKARAESLARENNMVKQDVLSKPQFTVRDVYADYPPAGSSDTVACVTFEGRDAAHSDPGLWMAEQYLVFVDLTTNEVIQITHVEPKQIPTPKPA